MAQLDYRTDGEADSRLDPYSPENLHNLENRLNNTPSQDDVFEGAQAAENYANRSQSQKNSDTRSNIAAAKDRENSSPWANNTGHASQGSEDKKGKFNIKNLMNRKSATGAIISVLLGGGLLGGGLLSPGLLIVHLKEEFVNKFDTRASYMERRQSKILNKKFSQYANKATCAATANVLCKMENPSSKMLKDMEKQGAEITDSHGKKIDLGNEGDFKNIGNAKIKMPNGAGIVDAPNLASAVDKEPVKAGFIRKVFNPRYAGYGDSSFRRVMGYFNISKANSLGDDSDSKKMKEKITDDVKNGTKPDPTNLESEHSEKDKDGKDHTVKENTDLTSESSSYTKGSAEDSKQIVKDVIEKESKKGAGPGMVVGIFCGAQEFSRTISAATRAKQIIQLVRFGMVFFTVADMIKAGTAKPEQVSMLGTMLTTVLKDNKGAITKKAATDGYGTKYALGQGLPPGKKPVKSTSNFMSFVPGGGVAGTIADALNNSAIVSQTRPLCKVINSTAGQLAMSIAGGPASLVAVISVTLLSDQIASLLAPLFESLVTKLAGNLVTGDIVGEDAGDAFAGGAAQMMSQTGASGGGNALSVSQAVAYTNNVVKPYQIAQANIDRATLSPFDASNKNTFTGSMYHNLLPTYSNLSSLQGIVSAPLRIIGTSVGIINQPAFAADDGYGTNQEFDASKNSCGDPNIIDSGSAAGPYCNTINAVPAGALDRDPVEVLNALKGQYDETSGDPTGGDLQKYKNDCMDKQQEIESAKECRELDAKNNNNLSLYLIDQTVQKDMDGEDKINDNSSASSASTGTAEQTPAGNSGTAPGCDLSKMPANAEKSGACWRLKNNTDYSSVPCAPGTTDKGTTHNDGNGITVRMCLVKSMPVASVISKQALDLVTAAAKDGLNITISSGLRTYSEQVHLYYDCYLGKKCNNGAVAAKPGQSNHEKGTAADWGFNGASFCHPAQTCPAGQNPGYDWFMKNASKYGFFKLPTEAWHWSTDAS